MKRTYKIRSKFIFKIIATVFFAMSIICGIISLNAIIYLSSSGGYDGISGYCQTADAKARAASTTRSAVLYVLITDEQKIYSENNFDRDKCNLSISIYKGDTNQLIYRNYEVINSTLRGNGYFYGEGSTGYYESYIIRGTEPTYRIEYALSSDLIAKDNFYYSDTIYALQYKYRYQLITMAIGSFIVFFASVIFLFCATGHVENKEGITLNWLNKIPLDIYA
ncbi:MAG: hypothetical protein MR283_00635 [Erysipelotrichaceae bacterium]|nr:hypothetical protein [Erysipelotrichaceae bacterium]MDY6034153.1 hypothetical protein [Bulleidia sp.]